MSEPEMDPTFVRLTSLIMQAEARAWIKGADEDDGGDVEVHRQALHRWHRGQVEKAVREAHREGYMTAADPAWCEKQLRRAGVKAEAHEEAAEEYFWNASETKVGVTE